MKNLADHGDWLAAQKLELAARNLSHLLKIQEEQATLENIVDSLQQTIINSHGNDPSDLCDMMATQARIMDATFHHFLDKSKSGYTEEEKIAFAFKAQQHSVRAALAWKKLKSESVVKNILVERTRQTGLRQEDGGI